MAEVRLPDPVQRTDQLLVPNDPSAGQNRQNKCDNGKSADYRQVKVFEKCGGLDQVDRNGCTQQNQQYEQNIAQPFLQRPFPVEEDRDEGEQGRND